jgi:TctA family transporter
MSSDPATSDDQAIATALHATGIGGMIGAALLVIVANNAAEEAGRRRRDRKRGEG